MRKRVRGIPPAFDYSHDLFQNTPGVVITETVERRAVLRTVPSVSGRIIWIVNI